MYRLEFAAEAKRDLLDIWQYIASDSLTAADDMIDRIEAACHELQHHPYLGRVRDELISGLRSRPVGNYVLLYCIESNIIKVLRVLHGARDIESLL